ncbi:hypothetical protein AALP_AA6G267400 [Arabis alpina]|uniref:TF-B3 domain-containing protein n=1 Tax=Arabis alpina TaxID=50452 RepID=A0A087GRW9_ARAAL|nr:hypothetical protein AALP_AA6G267400 [Arabis alpina]
MMFSDLKTPSDNNIGNISMIRQEASFSSNDQNKIEPPRKKKVKKNNPETEAYSSFHVSASNMQTDAMYLPQDFTNSDARKRNFQKKCSPRQILSAYSSKYVTFKLAPVDVRHCRLRLPVQFARENGINKPGKVYLVGKDGSKWLANLLLEGRGRMTLGDGWKSFVKANGLKTGESFTLEANWEDTTPVLRLCAAEYSIDSREGGGCSDASEKEPLPLEPSNRTEIVKDENSLDKNIDENSKRESRSWEREKSHLRGRDSTSPSQSRFLTLTITPDSLRHGRLRLPLQFMMENRMNKPGEITLLGKDGAKWLVSLLLERRERMSLGKGWKDFAKANGLKAGDSITLESIWEDETRMLSLLRIECSSDRRQQSECSKSREKKSIFTEPSSGNRKSNAESNREENRKYPHRRRESLAIQNRFGTSTLSPEIVSYVTHDIRIGEIVVVRDEGDMMFQVSDSGPNCCQIRDALAPSNNNDQDNIGSFSIKMHPHLRKEVGCPSYDQDIIELLRKKKVKTHNPGTEADPSSDHSCFVAHATASNLHTDELYLSQNVASSDGVNRKCRKKYSPTQITSLYSSSEKQLATFTLAPVDVRNCRLRLPMQFTRENGINKPGKIYLLGKDGSKWLANLLLESRGRMTLGDGWKSFVKANGLKTGESFALKLNWEDTIPVLSLCPAEHSIDSKDGGGCSEASEEECLSIEPSSGKEISNDDNDEDENRKEENSKEESRSWEREKNHLIWRDSTSSSQNRFLTLTITPDSLRHGRLRLPLQFMMENNMNKPGEISLLGKDGAKCLVSLLLEKRGRMSLGKGWKDFAKANGLKTGDSITLESTWEDTTPVLSLLRIECSNDKEQIEFSKQSLSTGHSSGNKTGKAENNIEGNRIVILTLRPEDVKDCKLHLPSQFMRTNGIIKLGKITLLGRSGMKWFAYLVSIDGTVALGNGWKGFCEANGVLVGESFILEFISREDTNHVFKFCSNFGDQIH